MKLVGFMNPKNAGHSQGGASFKEGIVKVDKSEFRIWKGKDYEAKDGKPATKGAVKLALVWNITRLDEDLEPLTDHEDNPITEELVFSLGDKALALVHPGKADGPDDQEVEDAGAEPGACGPTVYATTEFKFHEKTAFMVLMQSLGEGTPQDFKPAGAGYKGCGFKEDILNRGWAPDFKGLVCNMKTWIAPDKMQRDGKDQDVTYKIVDKILKAPYEKKGGKGASEEKATEKAAAVKAEKKAAETDKPAKADKQAKAATNGDGGEAEGALKQILQHLSSKYDGKTMTRKAMNTLINEALQSGKPVKMDPTGYLKVLVLAKDNSWMKANEKDYDMVLDVEEAQVVFGTPEAE